jgi:hypothetical protein
LSKKSKSKRATEQGADRVQQNQIEPKTSMSTKDEEHQKQKQEDFTIGGV